MELVVGALYRVPGGHILRFHGAWGTDGVADCSRGCAALRPPSHGARHPATGYSCDPTKLERVTAADLSWIRKQREQSAARRLTAAVEELDVVIAELEVACSQ